MDTLAYTKKYEALGDMPEDSRGRLIWRSNVLDLLREIAMDVPELDYYSSELSRLADELIKKGVRSARPEYHYLNKDPNGVGVLSNLRAVMNYLPEHAVLSLRQRETDTAEARGSAWMCRWTARATCQIHGTIAEQTTIGVERAAILAIVQLVKFKLDEDIDARSKY